jgi:hypothetical protein
VTRGIVARALIALALVVTVLSGVLIPGAGAGAVPMSNDVRSVTADAAVQRILQDTNAVRASRGLPALVLDPQLAVVAMNWTARMAAAGSISHNPSLRSELPGGWSTYGENVASGYSYTSVVNGWANSPGHYANMVGSYTRIGIGYAEAGGRGYYTEVFARYATVDVPGASGFVTAAYADVLGRTPASTEVAWWVSLLQRGYPRSGVASGFNNSDEYRIARIGEAYEVVLGRAAEPAGLAAWLDGMRRGALQSDDASRIFLTSQEYYEVKGGGADRGYIQALYDLVLGRASETWEEDYWMQVLATRGRTAVVDPMWMSEERLRRNAADMYTKLFGRQASIADQISWAQYARTNGVTAMRTAMMSSDEYFRRAVARFPG